MRFLRLTRARLSPAKICLPVADAKIGQLEGDARSCVLSHQSNDFETHWHKKWKIKKSVFVVWTNRKSRKRKLWRQIFDYFYCFFYRLLHQQLYSTCEHPSFNFASKLPNMLCCKQVINSTCYIVIIYSFRILFLFDPFKLNSSGFFQNNEVIWFVNWITPSGCLRNCRIALF